MIGRRVKLRLLEELRNPQCTMCNLGRLTKGNVCVLGKGNLNAPIMLVGEAPGEAEERTGKPFMGRAGQLLDKILKANGMQDMVYITNTCRCRPPENRKPTVLEQNACTYYMNREVAIVQPKVIVGLGRTAIRSICPNSVLGVPDRTVFWFNKGTILIPFVGTYHPAAPLYQGNDPTMIRTIRRHLFTAKSLAVRELSKV